VRLADLPPSGTASLSLAREVAELDRARAALRAGDVASARRELERYEADPEARVLRAEALYLKMEALLASGERSAASQTARDLLRAYPGSAHAARAEEVAGVPIP
jgi:uncharacterized membrane-anchored protein